MKERRTVLVALASVLSVVVWYVALFGPQRAEQRRVNKELAAAERQEQELSATLDRLRRLEAQRGDHEAQLARMRRLIPPEPGVGGFILAANHAALTSGVDWVSVAPAAPAAGTGGAPTTIALSIGVDGGFFAVLEYLRALEGLERLIVVDSLQLAPGGPVEGALQLSATMSARLFTTEPVAPAPNSEVPPAVADGG